MGQDASKCKCDTLGTTQTWPWVKIGQSIDALKFPKGSKEYNDKLLKGSDGDVGVWSIVPDVLPNNQNILNFTSLSTSTSQSRIPARFQMTPNENLTGSCAASGDTSNAGYSETFAFDRAYGNNSGYCQPAIAWSECLVDRPNQPAPPAGSGAQGACAKNQVCNGGTCQIGSWTMYPESYQTNDQPPQTRYNLSFVSSVGYRSKIQMGDTGTITSYCTNGQTNRGLNVVFNGQTTGAQDPPYGSICPLDPQGSQCSQNPQCTGSANVCVGGNCVQFQGSEGLTLQSLNIGGWLIDEHLGTFGATTELRFTSPSGNYYSFLDTGNVLSVCSNGSVTASLDFTQLPQNYYLAGINFSC
jgi:hypothetical protein